MRYAAFLRGVSPLNAKMSELARCFADAGYEDVKTVLGSGNVVFTARTQSEASLARNLEKAMHDDLGRAFPTIVHSLDALRALVASDPYAKLGVVAGAKLVVTFLRQPPATRPKLPIDRDGASILAVEGTEVFSAYVPSANGPVFMALIEKTFGKEVTTRTWDTVKKVIATDVIPSAPQRRPGRCA